MLKYINPGNTPIPSYNLLIGIGIALAMLCLQYDKWFLSRTEKERNNIHLSLLLATITGFSGAYIFDAFTQGISLSFDNLQHIGLTFFSGLLTGAILLTICLYFFKLPVLTTLNNLTPYFCIAHIFGRIGCFLAGCCYGAPTTSFLGISYPEGSLPYHHFHDSKLHPTQLYESFFILLVFLYLKTKHPKQAILIYFLSYSLFRFCVEFIRADNRGTVWNGAGITPSQLLSVITVAFLAIILVISGAKQFRKS